MAIKSDYIELKKYLDYLEKKGGADVKRAKALNPQELGTWAMLTCICKSPQLYKTEYDKNLITLYLEDWNLIKDLINKK